MIGDDGGPLIHNGSEEEQSSFDSTCRNLHRFLTLHSARQSAARKRGRKLVWVIGNPDHTTARVTRRCLGRGRVEIPHAAAARSIPPWDAR